MVSARRSYIMSRVKSKNTACERRLAGALGAAGLHFKKHGNVLGRPDIVIEGRKVAVFVDGDFWHGCPYHGKLPKTNIDFWTAKFKRNEERDRVVNVGLDALGWKVVRVWECQVRDDLTYCVARVMRACAE